jgi:hypothetical protein
VAVLTETTRRLIENSNVLGILSLVEICDGEQLEYPSWVPDWSSNRQWQWRFHQGGLPGLLEFLFDEPRRVTNATFLDGGRVMEMSGIYIATIEKTVRNWWNRDPSARLLMVSGATEGIAFGVQHSLVSVISFRYYME